MSGLYAGALLGNLAAGGTAWLLYRQALERLQPADQTAGHAQKA
jgi:hypothetical protein